MTIAPAPARARSTRRSLVAAVGPLLLAGGLVAACSSSSSTSTGTSTSSAAASTTKAGSTGSSTGGGTTGSAAATKVSANTASSAEIQAALTAAGVTNAARWTKEIEEYRPYPTDDPSLAKLRKEQQKYNPSADQLDKILSALQP